MKIAIDTLPLVSGHGARGMGVYTRNLIEAISKDKAKEDIIDAFEFSKNLEKLKDYDLIHYPYFDLFYHTLPIRKQTITVVTVPDVIPLLFPKYYPLGLKGSVNYYLQKIALRSVDSIITLTETSKKDIVRFLIYPQDQICPIYLAPNFKTTPVSNKEKEEIRKKFKLPHEFILYIGDVNWNKNLISLCQAADFINKTLVIVGKQAVNEEYDRNHIENIPLLTLQEKFGNNRLIKRLGFVNNEELNTILQISTIYCQPSLYEGFGLPVLEAMDAGIPIVASRTQAIVEIGEDAVEYFDPYNIKDLKNALNRVFVNKSLQITLIKKGKAKVKEFSWKKTARETLQVYEDILNK